MQLFWKVFAEMLDSVSAVLGEQLLLTTLHV
jgi:hypothetical protein